MKGILFILTLLFSFSSFSITPISKIHSELNIVLVQSMEDSNSRETINKIFKKHYYPYDILSIVHLDKNKDSTGLSVFEKLILIEGELKSRFDQTVNDSITDFLNFEIECLKGGSC